jgi:hydrogenase-4 component F
MNFIILLLISVPSFLSLGYFLKQFRQIAVISASISLALSVYILVSGLELSGDFLVDYLSRFFIIAIASIYLLSVVFGLGYHHRMGESRNMRLHLSLMDLFASSMFFSITVNNFGLLWFGIEATTVSSTLLLVIEREPLKIEVAWRYVIIVSAGLTISLLSVVVMYYNFHTLTISSLLSSHVAYSELTAIAAGTALVGYGTKIGLFPMHTWLPDAHSEAPSEISAMFSGVLLPVAIYALYRVYEVTASPAITNLFIFFGITTIIYSALMLPSQRYYKRMFAYSTMENMGLILLGFTIGGIALTGAMILLVTHAFGKGAAFYSSGNILEKYESKKIADIHGLKERMPYTSVALIMSSLAVTGAPPFGTFLGEFLILAGLYAGGYLLIVALVVASLLVAFASINFHVSRMVFSGNEGKISEPSGSQVAVALSASSITLLIPFLFLIYGVI